MDSNARDEAARQQRQERIDQQHELAESMLPGWRQIDGLVRRVRRDRDYPYFRQSEENRSCGDADQVNIQRMISELELSGDDDAQVKRQRKAMEADSSNREQVRCLLSGFDQWRARIQERCASMQPTRPSELAALRARSPDVPGRCFEGAAAAYRSDEADSLRTNAAAPRRRPARVEEPALSSPHGLMLKP
jgi:hypothetical protein